jgi:hypothetical protein
LKLKERKVGFWCILSFNVDIEQKSLFRRHAFS